jgi:hypothetical protein
MRGLERLAAIEANAWRAYQDARHRAKEKPNARGGKPNG